MRPFVLLLSLVAFPLALAPLATADAVYHTQRIDLVPVGGAPLQSGFVVNLHANGPQVYAHEHYVLNGASPNTAYEVTLLVYPFDTTCSVAAIAIPTAVLQTNVTGNGEADAGFLRPADVPAFLRGATHGTAWHLTSGAILAYETACSSVSLD